MVPSFKHISFGDLNTSFSSKNKNSGSWVTIQHHNHSNKRHKWIELLRQMEGGWKRLPTPLDAKERQIYLHQYPACGKK